MRNDADARAILLGAAAFLSLIAAGWAAESNAPQAQMIPFGKAAPTLRGDLSDPAWKDAATFSPFVLAGTKTPVPAPNRTEMKALARPDALYFSFKCYDPSAPKLQSKAQKHDDAVWSDDAVEIFINPDDKTYYQFLVSNTGARADLCYPAPEGQEPLNWDPSPDWEARTQVGEKFWTAEVKIPLAAIWKWKTPPQPGEHFRLKVCRLIYSKTANTNDEVHTSWNDALVGRSFADNHGWRLARLGGANLLGETDFSKWPPLSDRRVGASRFIGGVWSLQDRTGKGEDIGSCEIVKDPEPGVAAALKVSRPKPFDGQDPRLFVTTPLRPGRAYSFSAKVRSDVPLNFTINARPWLQHNMDCFKMPQGGWKKLTDVKYDFTVGEDSNGRDQLNFVYLWMDYKMVGEYLLVEPTLAETPTAEPQAKADMIRYHGMKSLAESDDGVIPLDRLNVGKDGSYDTPRVIYRDTVTGAEIWRVTKFPYADQPTGTGHKAWSADGKSFAFVSYWRPGSTSLKFMNPEALRITPAPSGIGAPGAWAPEGHIFYSVPYSGVYSCDPLTGEKKTLFTLPEDKKFQGRNWIAFSPESQKLIQYAWSFGKEAIIRLWDIKTMTYEDIPTRSISKPEFKDKDWLYSASWVTPEKIGYGLNHKPHLSETNIPQGWTYDLRTKKYEVDKDVGDNPSHGASSPSGKVIGYFREGLAYRPAPGKPRIRIGGLGGDGHMMFAYQDKIAVSGDVSDTALISMIYPDTRNCVPISYAQNTFTGYYGSIVFVSMSPDVTKLAFTSDMMGSRNLYWGIMNYPQPPMNVRAETTDKGALVKWDKPEWAAELAGYKVYRTMASGRDYRLLTPQPVAATEYLDAAAEKGKSYYYVVRSVEHSSLASRAFSNEAAINPAPGRRFYFEAEYGQSQEAPFRTTIDPSVVNEKLIQLRLLSDEAKDSIGRITCAAWPSAGTYRLWARVKRGLGSAADCGLTAQAHGEWGLGPKAFMPVASNEWTWKLMPGEVKATKGECLIEFTGFGAGLSLDRFCLTDDAAFTPKGKGSDVEIAAPPAPAGLQAAECRNFDIRLTWTASAAPEFSHYQVYRKRGEGVKAAQEFLVGSPCAAELLDYELRPGETYSYVITAVDDWGNESPASPAIVAKTADLPQRVEKTVALADVEGIDKAAKKLTDAKVQGIYRFDSSDKEKAELRIPFEVEADGSYVIWIHGAAIGDFQTALDYVVDGGTSYVSRYGAREYVQGQAQSERIQWDRLMCIGRDAGTVFPLKAGRHVLIIRNRKGSECSMVLDKILVTNDFSLLPQPNRFRL